MMHVFRSAPTEPSSHGNVGVAVGTIQRGSIVNSIIYIVGLVVVVVAVLSFFGLR
jgi:hypothetical protein